MSKIRIMIVEDKALVADDIEACLIDLGYEVVGKACTGIEAIEMASAFKPEIILMDINLKDGPDGIEAANRINKTGQIPIIYLTAYSDDVTLARAKLTHPYAYIVKPFEPHDLKVAIEIALANFAGTKEEISLPVYVTPSFIFVKNNEGFIKLTYDDILYLEASGSYCLIKTLEEEHLLSINLKTVLQKLSPHTFVKVHRSYAINLTKVDKFDNESVFIGGKTLPLGESFKAGFMNKIVKI